MKLPKYKLAALSFAAVTLGLLGLSSTVATEAQAKPIEVQAEGEKSKVKGQLEIDFRYEGLLFCDVSVNGSKDKFNFLIDSGAAQSVLSLRVAERLGVSMQDSPTQAGGVGKQDVKIASDVTFDVKGHKFSPSLCAVLDTSHVNDVSEIKLEGILGADWMQSFKTLDFDFNANTLVCTPKAEASGDDPMKGMMERVKKMLGGEEGAQKDDNDFDDDGVKSEDQLLLEAYTKFLFTSLNRYRMPKFAKTTISLPSPIIRANEEEEVSVEEMMEQAARERRLEDTKLEAADLKFQTIDAGFGEFKMTIVPWWIVKCELNDQSCNMVFDTGAGALLALDSKFGNKIDLGHSVTVTVAGVGKSDAGFGLVQKIKVGEVTSEEEQPAVGLDLAALTEQLSMLKMLGVSMEAPVGLLGLPYAMRYHKMRVDNTTKKISFTPYTEETLKEAAVNPHESNALVIDAIKNVWAKKAGSAGFTGEPLNTKDWPNEGVDGGVVVTKIRKGTSAEKNGLEKGDLVVAIVEDPTDTSKDGQMAVQDMDNLKIFAAFSGKGEKWNLLIKKKRTGAMIVQEFELGEFKSSKLKVPARYK